MSSNKTTYNSISAENVEDKDEVIQATTMVEVKAPATLNAGYTFNAIYEGVTFPVVVPAGGVTEGQTLFVPFEPDLQNNNGVGAWKDDLFACTRYGICHASLITACCCPLITLGQIMTRLKLNWCGKTGPEEEWSKSFQTMVYITIAYVIVNVLTSPASPDEQPGFTYILITFIYGVFMWILITRIRKAVRARDGIPETRCIGCEDFCCGLWCSCCTVAQLARQTADYDVEDGRLFTNDGLPPKETSPVVIV
jgi:Cys-rich protein (TIGR01571 family)